MVEKSLTERAQSPCGDASGKTDQAIQFLESAVKTAAPFAQRDASNKLLAELQKQKEKDDKDKKGTEPTSAPASK